MVAPRTNADRHGGQQQEPPRRFHFDVESTPDMTPAPFWLRLRGVPREARRPASRAGLTGGSPPVRGGRVQCRRRVNASHKHGTPRSTRPRVHRGHTRREVGGGERSRTADGGFAVPSRSVLLSQWLPVSCTERLQMSGGCALSASPVSQARDWGGPVPWADRCADRWAARPISADWVRHGGGPCRRRGTRHHAADGTPFHGHGQALHTRRQSVPQQRSLGGRPLERLVKRPTAVTGSGPRCEEGGRDPGTQPKAWARRPTPGGT